VVFHGPQSVDSMVLADFARRLERERDKAQAELAEWHDAAKHVDSDYPDERHCGCVPILRKQMKDARAEVARLREALLSAQHDLITSEGLYACDNAEGHSLFQLEHPSIPLIAEALAAVRSCEHCGGQGWYAYGEIPEQVQCATCCGTGSEALAAVRGETTKEEAK